jgi:hypothetical protein
MLIALTDAVTFSRNVLPTERSNVDVPTDFQA